MFLRRVLLSVPRLEFGVADLSFNTLYRGFASSKAPRAPNKKEIDIVKSKTGSRMTEQKQSRKSPSVETSPEISTVGQAGLVKTEGISQELQAFVQESLKVDQQINSPPTEPKSLANPNLTLVQVEGIPKDWSVAKIRTYFDPKGNTIVAVKPIVNKLGLSSGKTIIEFGNQEHASIFIRRYDNDYIELPEQNSHLRARLHTLSVRSQSLAAKIERDRTVMIYNLPFEATNKEVATVAGHYGPLSRVEMPLTSRNKNRGYALIVFRDPHNAVDMITQFQGVTMHGRE